jgi:hypothetical protein
MKNTLIIVILLSSLVNAQTVNNKLSGVLAFDSKTTFEATYSYNNPKDEKNNKKSVLLAGVLSFAVPGAGEIYAENYYMAGLFIAIEAAAITTGLVYDKKGDDQTTFYHNYANENWDVLRYAKWTINNLSSLNSQLNPDNYAGLFYDNGTKVNWQILNKLETDIGGWYSHKLPSFGEQQYYELIGKYPQFNSGWSDFGDENTPYKYGDPITEKFKYYSRERGKANDYYNVASKAVVIIIVNHIVSAFDAALSANRYNKKISLKFNLMKTIKEYNIEYYPQLNLQYMF